MARSGALRKIVLLIAANLEDETRDLLIELVDKDEEPKMRAEACKLLVQFGSEETIEALIDALDDEDTAVRTAAWSALRRLTRQSFKSDPEPWRRWLRLRS